MKSKHIVLLASPFVLLLSGCQLWNLIFPPAAPTLQQTLASSGFTALAPPSSLTPPGTIVEVTQEDPLFAETVCTQGQNLGGPGVAAVVSSLTNDLTLEDKVTATFNGSVDIKSTLSASVDASAVSSITEALSNAKILDLSVDSAIALAKKRPSDCQAAVDHVEGLHKTLTVITSAFVADVVYKVTWNNSVTASAKTAQLGSLSGALGVGLTNDGDSTISGTQLIWGIKDDATLVDLPAQPQNVPLVADIIAVPHKSRSIFRTSAPLAFSK
jgi:hypothetical protein